MNSRTKAVSSPVCVFVAVLFACFPQSSGGQCQPEEMSCLPPLPPLGGDIGSSGSNPIGDRSVGGYYGSHYGENPPLDPSIEVDPDFTSQMSDASSSIGATKGQALNNAILDDLGGLVSSQLPNTSPALPPLPASCGENCSSLVPTAQGEARDPSLSVEKRSILGSDPVDAATGELLVQETDLFFPGFGVEFRHVRTYRSRIDYETPLGFGWDHSYNQRLLATRTTCRGELIHTRGDGTSATYRVSTQDSNQVSYESPVGVYNKLVQNIGFGTTWVLTEPDGSYSAFDDSGLLRELRSSTGHGLMISWTATDGDSAPRVAEVIDSVGRRIRYRYDDVGRLRAVVEQATGVAVRYEQDENGDLILVERASGGEETYEYATGHFGGSDFTPERLARGGCKLACQPSSLSCDSGGACDAAINDAFQTCRNGCIDCVGLCKRQCQVDSPCRKQCPQLCQESCSDARGLCKTSWKTPYTSAAFSDDRGQSPKQLCRNNCRRSCRDICGVNERCRGCCYKNDAGFFEVIPSWLGGPSCKPWLKGCQRGRGCLRDCKDAFFGNFSQIECVIPREECASFGLCPSEPEGCLQTISSSCTAACEPRCKATCNQLSSSFCTFGCFEGCKPFDCLRQCLDFDFTGQCVSGCSDSCVTAEHQKGPVAGPKYGHPQHLNHNLLRAIDGEGRVYLRNEYGADITSPDFDRVIVQQTGDFSLSYAYRDLQGEGLGYLVPPAEGLGAGDVEATASFVGVDICRATCPPRPLRPDFPANTNVVSSDPSPERSPIRAGDFDFASEFATEIVSASCENTSGNRPIRTAQLPERFKAASATVVRDAHGVEWVFYFNSSLRMIRAVNRDTGAVRSLNYDRGGRWSGYESPLRQRACISYGLGSVITRIRHYPAPGGVGSSDPINQLFAYTDNARLHKVFDPRIPGNVLEQYEWDNEGRMVGKASGAVTTVVNPTPWGDPEHVIGPDGATITYEYDTTAGSIRRVEHRSPTDEALAVTEIESNALGLPLRAVDPLGDVTEWSWNGLQLVSQSAGAALQVDFEVDGNGFTRLMTDALREIEVERDELGLIQATILTDQTGELEPHASCRRQDPEGRLLEEVYADGTRRRYDYDGEGRLVHIEAGHLAASPDNWDDRCLAESVGVSRASGIVFEAQHDLDGRPIRIVSDGIETKIAYDGFGRPAIITDAGGGSHRLGFDALGNLVWEAHYNPDGVAVPYGPPTLGDPGLLAGARYTYDLIGRLSGIARLHFDDAGQAVGDGNAVETIAYDETNSSVSYTDDLGAETRFELDGLERVSRVLLPTDDEVLLKYLDGGRTVVETYTAPTPSGSLSLTSEYTAWGALSRLEAGSQATLLTRDYDSRRRLVVESNAGQPSIMTDFDSFDRPTIVRVEYGDNEVEERAFVYDRAERVRSVSSRAAHLGTTTYDYDALGRLVSTSLPNGENHVLDFLDTGSRPRHIQLPDGTTLHPAYDNLGRVARLTAERDGSPTQARLFSYDSLSRIISARDLGELNDPSDDIQVRLGWDSLDNLVLDENLDFGGESVRHEYSGAGLPIRSQLGGLELDRKWDALGRLTSVTVLGQLESLASLSYAGIGGPTSRTYSNGIAASYTYDQLGRLSDMQVKSGTTPVAAWRWERPLDGIVRLAGLKRGAGSEVASVFQLDQGGRLVAERHGVTGIETLELGPFDQPDQVSTVLASVTNSGPGRRAYTLDARHNWLERSASDPALELSASTNSGDEYTFFGDLVPEYDENGQISDLGTETFEYDLFGQLVLAARGDASIEYVYDGFGRRVRTTRSETGSTERYAADGGSYAMRKTDEGFTAWVQGGAPETYLSSLSADGSQAQFLHQDVFGNVFLMTGGDGAALGWTDYTAYGEPTVRDSDAAPVSEPQASFPGFRGLRTDADFGLVGMRARVYRPGWGRFLQRDPLGWVAGPNSYSFVDGAPLAWADPSGLKKKQQERELRRLRVRLRFIVGRFEPAPTWATYVQWATNAYARGDKARADSYLRIATRLLSSESVCISCEAVEDLYSYTAKPFVDLTVWTGENVGETTAAAVSGNWQGRFEDIDKNIALAKGHVKTVVLAATIGKFFKRFGKAEIVRPRGGLRPIPGEQLHPLRYWRNAHSSRPAVTAPPPSPRIPRRMPPELRRFFEKWDPSKLTKPDPALRGPGQIPPPPGWFTLGGKPVP